jgi:hypothetical protein
MINTKLHNIAVRKTENTVRMLLLLHRQLWDVMVFCAFEKIQGQMPAQKGNWKQ